MSSKAYHRRIWHEMQHLIAVGGVPHRSLAEQQGTDTLVHCAPVDKNLVLVQNCLLKNLVLVQIVAIKNLVLVQKEVEKFG